MSRSPYKLLDYYRFEDADLFFGREEETRKMVGEILSTRLLVLFSPSGSGKTSLIDAGVRPQMEAMGYKTIFTRMEDAPIPAICRALSDKLNLPPCASEVKQDLYEFIKNAVQVAGKPLVIFLDQFEEFFIIFRHKPDLRNEFIRQTAKIKYDDQLPVYLVFSLREDYFAHIHEFREVIPSIFQNNANIRLEAFDEKAARRAIETPLKTLGWMFEPVLTDMIIKDLNKESEGIEPIMLQMVCSALWDQRPKEPGEIPLSTYNDCGGSKTIIGKFIDERLNKVPHIQRRLLVRVCEALKTLDNTKRYRSFEDLQLQLKNNKPQRLKRILKLLVNLDVLRVEERSGTMWYEFKHDYVATEVNRWIKDRKERIQRNRLHYASISGLILFLSLFTYVFIQYNTFYASFGIPAYKNQDEEIVISRGFDIFGQKVSTGLFKNDVRGQDEINKLRVKLKIGFWDQNNWLKLVDILRDGKSGEFLYRNGQTKLGIEKLIQAFDEGFWYRMQTIKTLTRLGKSDKKVIDALFQTLKDEKAIIRRSSADVLILLGKADQKVIDALPAALKDSEPNMRAQAANIMGKLGKVDPSFIDALLQAMNDKLLKVRQQALSSLCVLGKADQKVIDALLNAMNDLNVNEGVRKQIAASLCELGVVNPKIVDTVLMEMKDLNYEVRKQAAISLGKLGKADQKIIDALLLALKDENLHVRREASKSLVEGLGKSNPNVIDFLIQALNDENKFVQVQSADVLVQMGKGNQVYIENLIQAMNDKDPFVQSQAAVTLIRLGKKEQKFINVLIQGLKNENDYVRWYAILSLSKFGKADQNFIDALLQMLKDAYPYIRWEAGKSLGTLWQNKSDSELLQILKDRRSEYRTAAANALAQRNTLSKETHDEIILLKDTDKHPWVRLGAWEAYDLIQDRKDEKK